MTRVQDIHYGYAIITSQQTSLFDSSIYVSYHSLGPFGPLALMAHDYFSTLTTTPVIIRRGM